MLVPFPGARLADHREIARRLVELGYRSAWTSETSNLDAVAPLAAVSAWAPELRTGTAVLPVQTRGPAVLAMTAAALSELCPQGTSIGIGASSPVVIHDWNDRDPTPSLPSVRDTVRFLRDAFSGRSVSRRYETFSVENFRLGRPVTTTPELLVAALRPRMLAVAAEEADGAITTMVSPTDVRQARAILPAPSRLVVWLTACPSADRTATYRLLRPLVAPYLCLPSYRAQQAWLGRSDALADTWAAWDRRDHRSAVSALPEEVMDALVVHGSPETCRRRVDEYLGAGADEVILSTDPLVGDPLEVIVALAPGPSSAQ